MPGTCGDPARLRIVSWNIGLRGLQRTLNVVAEGKLEKLCRMLQADVLCLQEVKSTRADLTEEIALADGHTSFFSCNRAFTQYSGVATIVADHVGTISMQEGLTGILAGATESDAAAAARVTVASETRASAAGSFSYTNNDVEDVSSGGRTYSNLELDSEGRCIITDHGAFVLVNVYAPAASSDGDRLSFKWQYHEALRRKVRQLLLSGVHVIVAGDLNVSHTQLDHCDPQEWIKHSHGRAFESGVFRRWMTVMLDGSDVLPTVGGPGVVSFAPVEALPQPGASSQLLASALLAQCNQILRMVDSFRTLHPTAQGAFTCWNQVTASRATNYGTRIDYILLDAGVRIGDGELPQPSSSSAASSSASPSSSADEAAPSDAVRLLEADVQQQFQGSDHCPVSVVLSVPLRLLTARRIDNTVGIAAASTSAGSTATQHTAVHPQSVNAYPEFNKRQKRLSSFFSKQSEQTATAVASDDGTLSALGTVASSSEPARSVASIAAGAAQTEAGLKRSISDSAAGAAAASKNKRTKPAVATATLHSFLKPAPAAVQSHASSKRKEPAASEADDSDVVVIDSSQDDAGTRTGTTKPAAERSSALLPMAASVASQPATSSSSSSSTNHLKPASTTSSSSTPAPAPSTAWASLLSGPVPAPMCACGVVTVERQSKQVNENLGRRFYVCPRPQGKTGDPNARCDFFLWADVHRQRVVQAAAGYRGNSAGAGAGSSSASSSSTAFR